MSSPIDCNVAFTLIVVCGVFPWIFLFILFSPFSSLTFYFKTSCKKIGKKFVKENVIAKDIV